MSRKQKEIVLQSAYADLPKKGQAFIAWKWGVDERGNRSRIIKLRIPANAARLRPKFSLEIGVYYAKCRASSATVLDIYDVRLRKKVDIAWSWYGRRHDMPFQYRVGQKLIPSGFTRDCYHDCGQGIHFFTTRKRARRFEAS